MFSCSFYQRVFFVNLLTEKLRVLVPKYYLLAGDTSQLSIFFLTQDNNQQTTWNIYLLQTGLTLTISKMFPFLSTLPVWELGIPWQLSKQISKVFSQMSAQVYSVPDQTEGRRRAFLERKSIDLSYKLSLTCGDNVNYYKSVHHLIPTRENKEHLGNFQNKSVSSAFKCKSRFNFQKHFVVN